MIKKREKKNYRSGKELGSKWSGKGKFWGGCKNGDCKSSSYVRQQTVPRGSATETHHRR